MEKNVIFFDSEKFRGLYFSCFESDLLEIWIVTQI